MFYIIKSHCANFFWFWSTFTVSQGGPKEIHYFLYKYLYSFTVKHSKMSKNLPILKKKIVPKKKSNKTSQKLYIFMTFGHFWSKAIVLELYEKSQKWQKWPFSAVFIKLQNHRLWSKMIKRHENLSIPSSFIGFFVRNNFIFVIGRFLDIFVFFTVKLYRYLYRK